MDEKTIRENAEFNRALLIRLRQKCVEKGTSITRIEEALGFGNGSISSGWAKAKRKAPIDRIEAVAGFLECSVDELMPQKKEPVVSDELAESLEILRERPETRTLLHASKRMTATQVRQIAEFMMSLRGDEDGQVD